MPPASDTLGDYLRARRAVLRPEDIGYPPDPGRRVSGLRREEVATRAGISLEYYVRLEQGRVRYRISETVLRGLALALRLDDDSAAYLYRLALPSPIGDADRRPLGELTRYLVEQWSDLPVFVHDRNLDVLLANDLAMRVFPLLSLTDNNLLKATFMAPAEGRSMAGWAAAARELTGALRYYGDPDDPRLRELVGELSSDSDFDRLWSLHDARPLTSGTSPVYVEGVGFGEVPWQALTVPGGFFLIVHLAPPGSFGSRAFQRLLDARIGPPTVTEFDGSSILPAVDAATMLADFERTRLASLDDG